MIDLNEIQKLAELARIEVSPEEAEGLAHEIEPVLEYVHQIQNVVGVGEIEPEVGRAHNVMRTDDVPHEPEIFSEELLNEAPQREGRYFKVKKILG